MRIGSLFSGAGGLDLAVQGVFGGEVVWHSEIDKAAYKVLAHRWPGVPNLGSITEIDWATVEPVDVLCGGFPCQDVSAAGKRAGIKDGTRSGLWAIFAQAIDVLRPQWVVIENVRGLLSAAAHRTVEDDAGDYLEPDPAGVGDGAGRPVLRAAGAVLGDLADLGYDAQWATVAAADVGAPHRRERVFILATDATVSSAVGLQQQDLSALQQRRGDRRLGELGVCDCGDSACVADASDTAGDGWDEGRPESAGLVGGFDAAVSGNGPVNLLPTPTAQSARHGSDSRFGGGNGDVSNLWQIAHLLPTPRNRDGKGATSSRSGDNKHDLPSAVAGAPGDEVDEQELWPVIRNAIGYEYGRQRANGSTPMFADDIDLDGLANAATEAIKDLPGPLRAQGKADSTGKPPESGPGSLPLLPTPEAKNSHAGPDYARMNREGFGGHDLVRAVAYHNVSESAWGKYEPAIRRWQAVAGPAPAPTEPNSNGKPRLNPAFSEWMMGWPPGWVTDPEIGISRNDQLRIVGNGVCPQQAAAALRYLLAITA